MTAPDSDSDTAGMQLYLVWVTYFYVSMALREGVLLVNGSHIRSWWIQVSGMRAGVAVLVTGAPQAAQLTGAMDSRRLSTLINLEIWSHSTRTECHANLGLDGDA